MKLKLTPKSYEVRSPVVQNETFTITRAAYNSASVFDKKPLRRLVKESGARKVRFPDLPSVVFYLHRNELGGLTVTESRTGLALHKTVNSKSVELCLSEATAKVEMGMKRNKGAKGFEKHIASLPSKQEYCTLSEPPNMMPNASNTYDSRRSDKVISRKNQS